MIEVMVSMVVISLIVLPIFKLLESTVNIWMEIQRELDLKQQARIISIFLENNIEKIIDFKIKDINQDGKKELYFNLGENIEEHDRTDENTNYYIQYKIKDKKLYISTIKNSLRNSGIRFPQWPSEDAWGYSRPVTVSIIKDYNFKIKDQKLVFYEFFLENKNVNYYFSNNIFPVNLWMKYYFNKGS